MTGSPLLWTHQSFHGLKSNNENLAIFGTSAVFNFTFCNYSSLNSFFSYFENTSDYSELLKNTFLFEYISNSLILLLGVLIMTLIIGVTTAYLVSFYSFPFSNF